MDAHGRWTVPAAWDETQNENEGSRWVALGRKIEIPRSKKKVLEKD